MKKLLYFIIFVPCVLLATIVHAGGWGRYGGRGYGGSSLYGSLGSAGSLYGSLGGGGSLYGSLGGGGSLYGSLGSAGSRYHGGHKGYYRGLGYYAGHRSQYRGHGYYGCGIAEGYIGTPGYIEVIPSPVYYVPAPVYYEPVPVAVAPTPISYDNAPVAASPTPTPTPAPVAVTTPDNVPSGHWEVQKIWVPNNKRSWIEKYYDESRDVWVLSNREEKLGTNGHWAEREIWVED